MVRHRDPASGQPSHLIRAGHMSYGDNSVGVASTDPLEKVWPGLSPIRARGHAFWSSSLWEVRRPHTSWQVRLRNARAVHMQTRKQAMA